MLAQTDRFTIAELCAQFGISRKTGYKHLERYALHGMKGLQPRSHRPHQCPQGPNPNTSDPIQTRQVLTLDKPLSFRGPTDPLPPP